MEENNSGKAGGENKPSFGGAANDRPRKHGYWHNNNQHHSNQHGESQEHQHNSGQRNRFAEQGRGNHPGHDSFHGGNNRNAHGNGGGFQRPGPFGFKPRPVSDREAAQANPFGFASHNSEEPVHSSPIENKQPQYTRPKVRPVTPPTPIAKTPVPPEAKADPQPAAVAEDPAPVLTLPKPELEEK